MCAHLCLQVILGLLCLAEGGKCFLPVSFLDSLGGEILLDSLTDLEPTKDRLSREKPKHDTGGFLKKRES